MKATLKFYVGRQKVGEGEITLNLQRVNGIIPAKVLEGCTVDGGGNPIDQFTMHQLLKVEQAINADTFLRCHLTIEV